MSKKKPPEKFFALFFTIFLSALVLLGELGLVRAMAIGSLLALSSHIAAIFLFQTVLFVLLAFFYSGFGKKAAVVFFVCALIGNTALWLLLIGFRYYVAGICASGAFLTVSALFVYGYKKINWRAIVCAAVVLIVTATSCLAFFLPAKIAMDRRKEQMPLADFTDGFPHAVPAKKIYLCSMPLWKRGDCLLIKSLQAYLSMYSDTQIMIRTTVNYSDDFVTEDRERTIREFYPDVEIEKIEGINRLMEKVGGLIDNYIFCDSDDKQSCDVACNLSNRFKAVVVCKDTQFVADMFGWKKVYDTTGKDEEWLIRSEYFDSLNKSLVFLTRYEFWFDDFLDYAILCNSWIPSYFSSVKELERRFSYLDRNFIVIGGIDGMEERAVITAASKYGGTFVFSGGMSNVSVLSGFRLENARKNDVNTENGVKKKTTVSTEKAEKRHTVCIMLSDGDNMRFTAGEASSHDIFFGSARRSEKLHLNYGMSGAMALIMPIGLLSYYDRMYTSEDFVMQLGSIGYVYPSFWNDEEAFKKVTDLLVESMEIADTHIVEIMDDDSFLDGIDFPSRFDRLKPYFDKYTCYDRIDGCLFIDFMGLYAGYDGEICWSNDKPVVSARYSVWNGVGNALATGKNEVEEIASSINKASKDVTCEDAYSFVIVHAWSGLDDDGNLIPNGDTVAAMEKLISLLDEDVDVVSATDFIARIKENVKR